MKQQRWLSLSVLVVLLWNVWNTQYVWQKVIHNWNTPAPRPSWVVPPGQTITEAGADTDTVLIHGGLIQAPRFRDTLRWWTGTWAGQVPFYRPLPSLLFWTEWKLFGDWENRYDLFTLLLYFLALYQFLRLIADLFVYFCCPFPALALVLTGLIFIDGMGMFPLRSATMHLILIFWKNQPDTLCACFFFLTLRTYLRAMPRPELPKQGSDETKTDTEPPALSTARISNQNRRSLWLALACYLAACACKESGILLPFLLIGLEWTALRSDPNARQAARQRLTPFFIALPLFLVYRAWCLGTSVGFRDGNNGSWLSRVGGSAFGPLSAKAVIGQWATVVLGLIFAACLWKARAMWLERGSGRKRSIWRGLALLLAVLTGLAAINFPQTDASNSLSLRIMTALLVYTNNDTMEQGIAIALFLAGAISGIVRLPALARVGYLWVLLQLMMIAASPGPAHRYYLLDGGYALWIGSGLILFAQPLAVSLNKRCLQGRSGRSGEVPHFL